MDVNDAKNQMNPEGAGDLLSFLCWQEKFSLSHSNLWCKCLMFATLMESFSNVLSKSICLSKHFECWQETLCFVVKFVQVLWHNSFFGVICWPPMLQIWFVVLGTFTWPLMRCSLYVSQMLLHIDLIQYGLSLLQTLLKKAYWDCEGCIGVPWELK